MFHIFDII